MRGSHRVHNLHVQQANAFSTMAQYRRALRDCGFVLGTGVDHDSVRPPMCLSPMVAAVVATKLFQAAIIGVARGEEGQ